MSTVSSVNGSTTSSSSVPSAPASTGLGTNDFLKLLVAQLKNQNPMNPTSGTEFLAQTAQFTVVEKLTEMNKQYSDLISSQRAVEATSFIGHSVAYVDDQGNSVVGLVSSVSFAASGPMLRIGKTDVPLASVSAVSG